MTRKKKIKPPYSGGSHIKLFLEIKLLHRLVGSQCSGADHLLGKVCRYPSINSHMTVSHCWYPSASCHCSTWHLTVLTIFIRTSRLCCGTGLCSPAASGKPGEGRGSPGHLGSLRQTQGIEPSLNSVSLGRFYLIFIFALIPTPLMSLLS